MTRSEFPYGVRMKGGVAFDVERDGFVAIVHSWDNVDCLGAPAEWQSERVFSTEDKAMQYYRRKVRPLLKKALRKAKRDGIHVEERQIEE
jgi:hypothetical protein